MTLVYFAPFLANDTLKSQTDGYRHKSDIREFLKDSSSDKLERTTPECRYHYFQVKSWCFDWRGLWHSLRLENFVHTGLDDVIRHSGSQRYKRQVDQSHTTECTPNHNTSSTEVSG
uniref:Uncharacterized protein n=1 Tax=Heterorhabditis bacteriophora TaxID=37862 RepID=A0A1I7WG15_HETBA